MRRISIIAGAVVGYTVGALVTAVALARSEGPSADTTICTRQGLPSRPVAA